MKLAFGAVSIAAAAVAATSLFCLAADKPEGKKKILFYSASFGFPHSVVVRPLSGEAAYAEKMLKEIAEKAGYELKVTQSFKDLEQDGQFQQYDVIVLYTTGNPLINRGALLKWLRNGGALIGIHTATDSFHSPQEWNVPMDEGKSAKFAIPDWPEYIRIIGAAFRTHGAQQPTKMKVNDADHPTIKGIVENGWTITDEIYQFHENRFNKDVHLLLSVDTENMDDAVLAQLKMKKGGFYPVSWTNTEGKGRVFYTSLGHREDVWTNEVWRKHLLAGIAWALHETDK